jgi:phthiocerol/phenolphthiocerol synthesis type-I polyketide synthase E
MQDPDIMFPALFAVQHAMGVLLESWGLKPNCVMGHSSGEYAAAVRAGVMDLETAAILVGTRSTLMMKMPKGGMISVPTDADTLAAIAARHRLSIGAANAPGNTALSGEILLLDAAEKAILEAMGLECKHIHVGAALHSHLTTAIAGEFSEVVAKQTFRAPKLRWISTVTGKPMDLARAPEPRYWVDHLCRTVRFQEAVRTLLSSGTPMTLLDLGPGRVAGDLLRQNLEGMPPPILQVARGYSEETADEEVALSALAKAWALGADVDWTVFNRGVRPPKLNIPTYPWQRRRYWIDPPENAGAGEHVDLQPVEAADTTAPESSDDRPALTSPWVAAETKTETRLLTIWQRFFGIGQIGTADDFIELGGTSLLATQLVKAINTEFGVKLELGIFLKCQNIAAVSKAIDAQVQDRDACMLAEALAEIEGKSDDELTELIELT